MIRKLSSVFTIVLLVASCSMAPPVTRLPELTFAQVEPVLIDAGIVEITRDYRPPLAMPNVEHLFEPGLSETVEGLLRSKLTAAGVRSRILRARITDASVVEERLPVTDGLRGMFLREPETIYRASLMVRLELVDQAAPDAVLSQGVLTAVRSKTLMEGAPPAEKQRAYFQMVEAIMDDVGKELPPVVAKTFGKSG